MKKDHQSTSADSKVKPTGYFKKAKGITNCYQYIDSDGRPGAFYFRGNINGREMRKRLQNKDRTVLQREILSLVQKLRNQAEGKLIPKRLGEFLDQYIEVLRADIAPKTLENVVWVQKELRRSFRQLHCNLDEITTGNLRAWLDDLILEKTDTDPKTGQRICRFGNRSRNIFRLILIKIFKSGIEHGFCEVNPAEALCHMNEKPKPRPLPTLENYRQILQWLEARKKVADCVHTSDYFNLMFCSGLGNAEISALQWRDVDFQREILTVRRKKTSHLFKIPLHPDLKHQLLKLQEKAKVPDCGIDPNGSVVMIKSIKRSLTSACRQLNLPHFSPRSFRKLHISEMLMQLEVPIVAKWQGHQDGGKTLLAKYAEVISTYEAQRAKEVKLVS
jgi:hypothetical protein